jgi:hypothetical protein
MAVRDPEVQDMLDEFALHKLVHAYCRAVDRGDLDLLRTLYHPDASDAHGALSTGSVTEFLDQLVAMRPYVRSMQHNITTVNFAVDGDVAEGEIYTIATHTVAGGAEDVDVVVGGRYLDKYQKRAGAWGFVERMIVTDWAHVMDPSVVDLSHPITRGSPMGAPDGGDPSHEFFSLLKKRRR